MTKWDQIQLEKISKSIDEIVRAKHINHVDFYYRFQGKTIKKTDSWRTIPDRERKTYEIIKQSGIDTDREPLLFDFVCYKDNPLETKLFQLDDKELDVIGMFRGGYRKIILNSGITEGDIETWLRELITEKK